MAQPQPFPHHKEGLVFTSFELSVTLTTDGERVDEARRATVVPA